MIPYIPEWPRKWSSASCFPSPAIRASAATKSPLRTSGSRRTSTPGCLRRQLLPHRLGGARELVAAGAVARRVADPDHRAALPRRLPVDARQDQRLVARHPGAAVVAHRQRLPARRIEDAHPGDRRAVEVQRRPRAVRDHRVDPAGDDRDRITRAPATGRAARQDPVAPDPVGLGERAVEDAHHAHAPGVIVRRALGVRAPAGEHHLARLVTMKRAATVGLARLRPGAQRQQLRAQLRRERRRAPEIAEHDRPGRNTHAGSPHYTTHHNRAARPLTS